MSDKYLSPNYNYRTVEQKWQNLWDHQGTFKTLPKGSDKPKYYVLEMFPYPSGYIHMGHMRNYSIGDVIARFKRSQGFNVLHPMGWDSFGLPAENAAKEHNLHPKTWTYNNIHLMRNELKSFGLTIDWDKELITSSPEYYRHEQAMFIDFYQHGLAYKKQTLVNWDPVEETVLANEQVIDGKGWRSGALVEQKSLSQWFLKITDFNEDLLSGLKQLSDWPAQVLTMQKNWIGKSTGASIKFTLLSPVQAVGGESIENEASSYISSIEVFSTQPHTIFGASFVAISKEHPLAVALSQTQSDIAQFIKDEEALGTKAKGEIDIEKRGINTGLKVKHPLCDDIELPVYIANFVLQSYGTGAIFGVPAHDSRDYDFALKYKLPIKTVLMPLEASESFNVNTECFVPKEDAVLINSGEFNGLSIKEAKSQIINLLEKTHKGEKQTNYQLHDWGISRQRYWGAPIPMIHCSKCGIVPEKKENLPVTLPEDVDFANSKGNPLDSHPTWKYTICPKCGNDAIRETDTFDTFMESSWYFLQYTSSNLPNLFTPQDIEEWLPVNKYIGGIEHAIMHLLYARFFVRALSKVGYLNNLSEPFASLTTQGMICHKTYKDKNNKWVYPEQVGYDQSHNLVLLSTGEPAVEGCSEKMSKSKKNTVSPGHIKDCYGVDTARMFVLSDAPPTKDLEWSSEGVEGTWKFINRLWRLGVQIRDLTENNPPESLASLSEKDAFIIKLSHQTIKKVAVSLEGMILNKSIAQCRELFNAITSYYKNNNLTYLRYSFNILLQLLNPFIPHITEELWSILGNKTLIANTKWPEYNPDFIIEPQVTMALQINGKTKEVFTINSDSSEEEVLQHVKKQTKFGISLNDKPLKKVIYVKNKIINILI